MVLSFPVRNSILSCDVILSERSILGSMILRRLYDENPFVFIWVLLAITYRLKHERHYISSRFVHLPKAHKERDLLSSFE